MTDTNDISYEVLSAIRRIIRAIEIHSRKLEQKYGLTGPQLHVLSEINSDRETSVSDIAIRMSLSSATVTDIINRLEKRELVSRTKSATDKRRVDVKLTKNGRKLLDSAPPLLQESFVDEFHKLKDWEQSLILSSLQRIVALMRVEDIDAASVLATGPIAGPEQTARKQEKPSGAF